MKKDKKWAIKEIDNYLSLVRDAEERGALWFAKDVINQLDEPEVLSREFINEKAVEVYADTADAEVHVVYRMRDLQNLLVPKQELPVIPKFVADWIKFKKESRIPYENVLQAIDELVNSSTSKAHDWVLKTSENKDTFARAWLDGYTVEEQKYRVVDRHEVHLLAKEEGHNKVETVAKLVEFYGHEHVELNYQLTEQEIKDYDERYFAFAVKVEEMEE